MGTLSLTKTEEQHLRQQCLHHFLARVKSLASTNFAQDRFCFRRNLQNIYVHENEKEYRLFLVYLK